jgi:mRNA-degrading endonuclease RelE of RelBE toxin-antitoxin system
MARLLNSISIRRPAKSAYQDLPEEERQQIKDLLFISEKNNVIESI